MSAADIIHGTKDAVECMDNHGGIGSSRVHANAWAHPDDDIRSSFAKRSSYSSDLFGIESAFLARFFRRPIFCLFVPIGDEAERIVFLEGFRLDRFTGNELVFTINKVTDEFFVPKSFG